MSLITTRRTATSTPTPPGTTSAADGLAPLLEVAFGGSPPVRFTFWDGSAAGPPDGPGTLHLSSPTAIRRIMWAPGELGLARAYIAGEMHAEGDVFAIVAALRDAVPDDLRSGGRLLPAAVKAARDLDVLGPPPEPPPEEARVAGWRHSLRRDARAIGHHYDVGNDFYRLILGPSMTYSCARFVHPDDDLATAQEAKHELVCRKLGLHVRPGQRLLDVGCGWGSMAIHAAREYGARVVGITISREQAALATQRVVDAGVDDLVQIRLQDYREVAGERYDAISSIGMSEHVGATRIDRYFTILRRLLVPSGRVLDHAISSTGGSRVGRRSFAGRYVFPDGEMLDVADKQLAMERAGLEIRDVESLREHYALTLRRWVANLEANWNAAVSLVGEARARVWRLYMAGSALGFGEGALSVHQVLAVRPTDDGTSAMSRTRVGWG